MKKIIALLTLLTVFSSTFIFAQEETDNESSQTEVTFAAEKDSQEDSQNDGKKHWFSAFGGVLFFNVGLATYNRYAIGADWAQTGPSEWSHFWERRLAWDDDWYWTNFVLHPYQGSLYYMSARNSNLNVFESALVTMFGSAFWEYLCETNAPSKNDMVYTTVGAFAVGEMLYRLSMAVDGKTRIGAYALDPIRLFNEFVTKQKPMDPKGIIKEFTLKVSAGTAESYSNILYPDETLTLKDYNNTERYPVFGSAEMFVVYNDPYTNDSNTPYNQFELRVQGSAGKGSGTGAPCNYATLDKNMMYNIEIESDGMLWSRSPSFGETVDTSLGFIMEYDFDWHSYYLLSSLAPGLAFKQRFNFENSRLEYQLHGAWIALGTADYYYLRRSLLATWPDGLIRPYSYTTGAESVFKIKYATKKGSSIGFDFHGYAMYDFYNQVKEGTSTGWEYIGKGTLSAELAVSDKVRIGLSDRVYAKRTFYRIAPDVFQILNTAQAYVKWAIK